MLELPEILDISEKLLPIITDLSKYRYFLIEGGRGGSKSQSVGRLILYLSEMKSLRVVCGREIQNSIQESVYALLTDLIGKYNLYFEVMATKITHRKTGTPINFRGFREQGAINIQGMEGVDIVWIDEAQAITKQTLDALIPTIRKENAKLFFTMNRFIRNDPVYDFLVGRDDCLHIQINYYENKFCPEATKKEANECKLRSDGDYRHIWLGEPLDQAEDYLFNFAKLDLSKVLKPSGNKFISQSVMGVDFSGAGGDLCVASLLTRKSDIHWELTNQIAWNDKDTDVSVGKTIALRSQWSPNITVVDKGGLGYPMFCSLKKSIPEIEGFDGAEKATLLNSGNKRADGYLTLKEFIDSEFLILGNYESTIKELETIRRKYKANGLVYIQSKEEMRSAGIKSPDRADSLMMATWAVRNLLVKKTTPDKQPVYNFRKPN